MLSLKNLSMNFFLIYLIAKLGAYCCWCTLGVWWLSRDTPHPWKHGLSLGGLRLVLEAPCLLLFLAAAFLLQRHSAPSATLYLAQAALRLLVWAIILWRITRLSQTPASQGWGKKTGWLFGGMLSPLPLDGLLLGFASAC